MPFSTRSVAYANVNNDDNTKTNSKLNVGYFSFRKDKHNANRDYVDIECDVDKAYGAANASDHNVVEYVEVENYESDTEPDSGRWNNEESFSRICDGGEAKSWRIMVAQDGGKSSSDDNSINFVDYAEYVTNSTTTGSNNNMSRNHATASTRFPDDSSPWPNSSNASAHSAITVPLFHSPDSDGATPCPNASVHFAATAPLFQLFHSPNSNIGKDLIATSNIPSKDATPTNVPNSISIASNNPSQNSFLRHATNGVLQASSSSSSTANILEKKYPRDSYSFLALHGPFETKEKTLYFCFGLLPFIFQVLFLVLLLCSKTNELHGTIGEVDNPDEAYEKSERSSFSQFIAAGTSDVVRVTQVVAVAAYLIFPDSSVKEIVRAVQTFPKPSKIQSSDPKACMGFACLLRAMQGILAMVVSLLLVVTSDTVVDIILNFIAVNFISYLDNHAFLLALSGDFGLTLQAESERVANTDMPPCMCLDKKAKSFYHRIIQVIISLLAFGLITFVFVSQDDNYFWMTRTLRVHFKEETGLNQYSGCFQINDDPRLNAFGRQIYNSLDDTTNTSFGYCRKKRQWILFEGNTTDPCDAHDDENELARSLRTDTFPFDISTSFDESWVSASNSPLDMYFFDKGQEDNLHCNITLGDTSCNKEFNILAYDFDDGDCCAATCNGASCGQGGPISLFGKSSDSFLTFPECYNPDMVPIAIHFNSIENSRNRKFDDGDWNNYDEISRRSPRGGDGGSGQEYEYRNAAPEAPYFSLICDGKIILRVHVEESMVNRTETVRVNDGANCRVETDTLEYIVRDTPIWFVNYTIFHAIDSENGKEQVEIITESTSRARNSNELKPAFFKRIPECYFSKLSGRIDTTSIYQMLDWQAVDVDKDNFQCGERFALFSLAHSTNRMDAIIQEEDQCFWPTITCSSGNVVEVDISSKGLSGIIPKELGLLTNLEVLVLKFNQLLSLPSEIGNLSSLKTLDLTTNKFSSLPSQIGLLSSLEALVLDDNEIVSLPSEIGQLSNLTTLSLEGNSYSLTADNLPHEIISLCSSGNCDCKGLEHSLGSQRLHPVRTPMPTLPPMSGQIDASTNQIRTASPMMATSTPTIVPLPTHKGTVEDEYTYENRADSSRITPTPTDKATNKNGYSYNNLVGFPNTTPTPTYKATRKDEYPHEIPAEIPKITSTPTDKANNKDGYSYDNPADFPPTTSTQTHIATSQEKYPYTSPVGFPTITPTPTHKPTDVYFI